MSNFKDQRGGQANRSIAKFAILTSDGKRREVEHYDLTVVVYVGFRAQATERVIQFQDWVGAQLDMLLAQQKPRTTLQVLQEVVQQMVEQEAYTSQLARRQDNLEQQHETLRQQQENTGNRLSRLEAGHRAMVEAGAQLMSVTDYCYWKNLDSTHMNLRNHTTLVARAKQLSHSRRYRIGKTLNQSGGYDDTFHLDVLDELFAGYH